ncbi:MAG TPA: glycosyltransferase, partial [Myxococcota bacterium]
GTTATALRAGRPQLIVAVLGDQAFWGRRIKALGVGGYVRFKDLDVDVLARLLRRLHRADVREKAEAAARAVRDDDGPLTAALAIERRLHR